MLLLLLLRTSAISISNFYHFELSNAHNLPRNYGHRLFKHILLFGQCSFFFFVFERNCLIFQNAYLYTTISFWFNFCFCQSSCSQKSLLINLILSFGRQFFFLFRFPLHFIRLFKLNYKVILTFFFAIGLACWFLSTEISPIEI